MNPPNTWDAVFVDPEPIEPRYLQRLPHWFIAAWWRNYPGVRRHRGQSLRQQLQAVLGLDMMLGSWGTQYSGQRGCGSVRAADLLPGTEP